MKNTKEMLEEKIISDKLDEISTLDYSTQSKKGFPYAKTALIIGSALALASALYAYQWYRSFDFPVFSGPLF